MLIKKQSLAMIALLLSTTALAASDHYLTLAQAPDSFAILPPPPSYDSIDFLRDKALYDAGKALRSTARGQQAYADADASGDSLIQNFSAAFGVPLSATRTPAIYRLIGRMKEDAGDYATRSAKQHYNRIRPFAFFKEPTCRSDEEKTLASNGSYPSGHTTIGWATALVLAELEPARENAILRRGYEMGQSRVICGYHWQSDVDAARLMASAVVVRLHADPAFMADLASAKAELKQLKHQG